jgi:hypothetical protein
MWRAGFERGFGPVVRQTTKWMNESGGDNLTRVDNLPPETCLLTIGVIQRICDGVLFS